MVADIASNAGLPLSAPESGSPSESDPPSDQGVLLFHNPLPMAGVSGLATANGPTIELQSCPSDAESDSLYECFFKLTGASVDGTETVSLSAVPTCGSWLSLAAVAPTVDTYVVRGTPSSDDVGRCAFQWQAVKGAESSAAMIQRIQVESAVGNGTTAAEGVISLSGALKIYGFLRIPDGRLFRYGNLEGRGALIERLEPDGSWAEVDIYVIEPGLFVASLAWHPSLGLIAGYSRSGVIDKPAYVRAISADGSSKVDLDMTSPKGAVLRKIRVDAAGGIYYSLYGDPAGGTSLKEYLRYRSPSGVWSNPTLPGSKLMSFAVHGTELFVATANPSFDTLSVARSTDATSFSTYATVSGSDLETDATFDNVSLEVSPAGTAYLGIGYRTYTPSFHRGYSLRKDDGAGTFAGLWSPDDGQAWGGVVFDEAGEVAVFAIVSSAVKLYRRVSGVDSIRDVGLYPSDPAWMGGKIYAGDQVQGMAVSSDDGVTWTVVDKTRAGGVKSTFPDFLTEAPDGTFYLSLTVSKNGCSFSESVNNCKATLLSSEDHGRSWSVKVPSMQLTPTPDDRFYTKPRSAAVMDDGHVWVAFQGAISGTAWGCEVRDYVPDFSSYTVVHGLASDCSAARMAKAADGTVWYGFGDDVNWSIGRRLTNGSWSVSVTSGLTSAPDRSNGAFWTPQNASTAFACRSEGSSPTGNARILRTTDGGANWASVDSGAVSSSDVMCVGIVSNGSTIAALQRIYASGVTTFRLRVSEDGGSTWATKAISIADFRPSGLSAGPTGGELFLMGAINRSSISRPATYRSLDAGASYALFDDAQAFRGQSGSPLEVIVDARGFAMVTLSAGLGSQLSETMIREVGRGP